MKWFRDPHPALGCIGATVAVALLWFATCLLRGLGFWCAVLVAHDYWWATIPQIDFWWATVVANFLAAALHLPEWRSSRK